MSSKEVHRGVDLDELKTAPLIFGSGIAPGLQANVVPSVYRIHNDANGLFFDDLHGLAAENNPIITHPDNGSDAQLWTIYRVGETDVPVAQSYALQNAASAMFARATSHDIDAGLVISETYDKFKFFPEEGNPTLFRIRPTERLNLAVQGAGDYVQTTLRSINKTQRHQLWRLVRET